MALAYAREGGCNAIVTKQSSAAAETITLAGSKVNGGSAYSIVGGTIDVITSVAGNIDIKIGGTSVLAAVQSTAAAGTFALILSDSVANLSGADGADLTIITDAAAKCQVNLLISGTLEDVV